MADDPNVDAQNPNPVVTDFNPTHYAYPGDTTPDSDSAKGIGAYTANGGGSYAQPALQHGFSVALTDSMAQRLGATPGDRIQVKDADGNTKIVGYHDRAPEADDRLDFYDPHGKPGVQPFNAVSAQVLPRIAPSAKEPLDPVGALLQKFDTDATNADPVGKLLQSFNPPPRQTTGEDFNYGGLSKEPPAFDFQRTGELTKNKVLLPYAQAQESMPGITGGPESALNAEGHSVIGFIGNAVQWAGGVMSMMDPTVDQRDDSTNPYIVPGVGIRSLANELYPEDPNRPISRAVGDVAGFVAPIAATAGMSEIPEAAAGGAWLMKSAAAGMGAGMFGSQMYTQAADAGAMPVQANLAGGAGLALGSLVPESKMLSPSPAVASASWSQLARNVGFGAVLNASKTFFQMAGINTAANEVSNAVLPAGQGVDPSTASGQWDLVQNAIQGALTMAPVGALSHGVAQINAEGAVARAAAGDFGKVEGAIGPAQDKASFIVATTRAMNEIANDPSKTAQQKMDATAAFLNSFSPPTREVILAHVQNVFQTQQAIAKAVAASSDLAKTNPTTAEALKQEQIAAALARSGKKAAAIETAAAPTEEEVEAEKAKALAALAPAPAPEPEVVPEQVKEAPPVETKQAIPETTPPVVETKPEAPATPPPPSALPNEAYKATVEPLQAHPNPDVAVRAGQLAAEREPLLQAHESNPTPETEKAIADNETSVQALAKHPDAAEEEETPPTPPPAKVQEPEPAAKPPATRVRKSNVPANRPAGQTGLTLPDYDQARTAEVRRVPANAKATEKGSPLAIGGAYSLARFNKYGEPLKTVSILDQRPRDVRTPGEPYVNEHGMRIIGEPKTVRRVTPEEDLAFLRKAAQTLGLDVARLRAPASILAKIEEKEALLRQQPEGPIRFNPNEQETAPEQKALPPPPALEPLTIDRDGRIIEKIDRNAAIQKINALEPGPHLFDPLGNGEKIPVRVAKGKSGNKWIEDPATKQRYDANDLMTGEGTKPTGEKFSYNPTIEKAPEPAVPEVPKTLDGLGVEKLTALAKDENVPADLLNQAKTAKQLKDLISATRLIKSSDILTRDGRNATFVKDTKGAMVDARIAQLPVKYREAVQQFIQNAKKYGLNGITKFALAGNDIGVAVYPRNGIFDTVFINPLSMEFSDRYMASKGLSKGDRDYIQQIFYDEEVIHSQGGLILHGRWEAEGRPGNFQDYYDKHFASIYDAMTPTQRRAMQHGYGADLSPRARTSSDLKEKAPLTYVDADKNSKEYPTNFLPGRMGEEFFRQTIQVRSGRLSGEEARNRIESNTPLRTFLQSIVARFRGFVGSLTKPDLHLEHLAEILDSMATGRPEDKPSGPTGATPSARLRDILARDPYRDKALQSAQDYLDKRAIDAPFPNLGIVNLFRKAIQSGRGAVDRLIDRLNAGMNPEIKPQFENVRMSSGQEDYLPGSYSVDKRPSPPPTPVHGPGSEPFLPIRSARGEEGRGTDATLRYQNRESGFKTLLRKVGELFPDYSLPENKYTFSRKVLDSLGAKDKEAIRGDTTASDVIHQVYDHIQSEGKEVTPEKLADAIPEKTESVAPVSPPKPQAKVENGKIVTPKEQEIAKVKDEKQQRVDDLMKKAQALGQNRFVFHDPNGQMAQVYTGADGHVDVRVPESSIFKGGKFDDLRSAIEHLVDNGFEFKSTTLEKKIARDETVKRFAAMVSAGLRIGQKRFHFGHEDGRTAALISRSDGRFTVSGTGELKRFASIEAATNFLHDRGFKDMQSSTLEAKLREAGEHPDQPRKPLPPGASEADLMHQPMDTSDIKTAPGKTPEEAAKLVPFENGAFSDYGRRLLALKADAVEDPREAFPSWTERAAREFGVTRAKVMQDMDQITEEVAAKDVHPASPTASIRPESFAQQMANDDRLDDDMRALMASRTYEQKSNELTNQEANSYLAENGDDAAYKHVTQTVLKGAPTRVDAAVGMKLVQKLRTSPNPVDRANGVELGTLLTRELVRMGQFTQAFRMWSKLGPEGILHEYDKMIGPIVDRLKKPLKGMINAVTDLVKTGRKQAADETIEDLGKGGLLDVADEAGNRATAEKPPDDSIDENIPPWEAYMRETANALLKMTQSKPPEIKGMIDEFNARMRQHFKESIRGPKPEGEKKTPLSAEAKIGEMYRNDEKYREAWNYARAYLDAKVEAEYADDPEKLSEMKAGIEAMFEKGFDAPLRLHDAALVDELKNQGTNFRKVAKLPDTSAFKNSSIKNIMDRMGLTLDQKARILPTLESRFDEMVKKGKAQNEESAARAERIKQAEQDSLAQGIPLWQRYRDKISASVAKLADDAPVKVKPHMKEFADRVTANLKSMVNETKTKTAMAKVGLTPEQKVRQIYDNFPEYKQAWDEARNALRTKIGNDPKKLAEFDVALNKTLDAPVKLQDKILNNALKRSGMSTRNLIKEWSGSVNATRDSLIKGIQDRMGLAPDKAKILGDAIGKTFENKIAKARASEIARILKQTGNPKVIEDAPNMAQKILNAVNLGMPENEAVWNALADKLGLPKYDPAVAADLRTRAEEIQRLIAERGGPGKDTDDKTQAMLNALADEAQKYISYARQFGQGELAIFYGNIFGPSTFGRKSLSETANALAEVTTMALADMRHAPNAAQAALVAPRAYAAFVRGLYQRGGVDFRSIWATGRGLRQGEKVFEESHSLSERGKTFGTIPGLSKLNPILSYYKYVGRGLYAAQAFFYAGAQEARANMLAYRRGWQDEKDGKITDEKSLNQWVAEILGNSPEMRDRFAAQAAKEGFTGREALLRAQEIAEQHRPEMIRDASADFALRSTFMQDPGNSGTVLGHLYTAMAQVQRKVPASRLVIPVLRTVTNVTDTALGYTPISGLWRAYDMAKEGRADDAWQQMAKVALGGIGCAVSALVFGNNIQGYGPNDYRQRQQLMAGGWLPYSIKVGNGYYSYRESPIALYLAGLGSWYDQAKYADKASSDLPSRLALAVLMTAKFEATSSWLESVHNALDAMDSPTVREAQTKLGQIAGGTADALIPFNQSSLKVIDKIFDPLQYPASGVRGTLMSQIAFARRWDGNGLPQLNALGDPVTTNPVQAFYNCATPDSLWSGLAAQNLFLPVPNKGEKVNGRQITDDELWSLVHDSGQLMRQWLEDGGLPELQGMPDDMAQTRLKQVYEKFAARNRAELNQQAVLNGEARAPKKRR